MCGIAGVWASPGQVPATALAGRMIATLGHRGPDSSGVWADSSAGVQLAHARLAIIDLSPAGAQPMVSHDGRLVIVLNGEIYNHAEIRRKLAQHEAPIHWRGSSDTETLLQAICALGLDAALELAVGMFAFALYDTAARTLTLVRDRFGEKPLYWGWTDDGAFVFASELKALRKHPAFGARIDPVAVQELLTYAYISAPRSIYMGVQKLEPGGRLVLHSEGRSGREARLDRYFSLHALLCSTQAEPYRDERTALDELEAALMAAVARQSVADVPVGAFLSGGIDSSLIVSLKWSVCR